MGKATGFLEYNRDETPARAPLERIQDFKEFHGALSEEERRRQGARCMNCGVPFCQSGMTLHGMVTDRDLVLRCVAAEEDPRQVPVRQVMSRHPAQVAPGDDVRQAAQRMARQQVRRLPVVEGGKVVGMVSLGDLAKCGRYEMEISRALTDISENIRRP